MGLGWIVLVLGGAVALVGLLLLARRRPDGWWRDAVSRSAGQHPSPNAMKRALVEMEHDPTFSEGGVPVLCDPQGRPSARDEQPPNPALDSIPSGD